MRWMAALVAGLVLVTTSLLGCGGGVEPSPEVQTEQDIQDEMQEMFGDANPFEGKMPGEEMPEGAEEGAELP